MRVLAYILATIFLVLQMIIFGLLIHQLIYLLTGISFTSEVSKLWIIGDSFSGFIANALGLYGIYTKRIALITPALLLASVVCISRLVGFAIIATSSPILVAAFFSFIGAASLLYIIWDINKSRSIEK